ncbi:hypothetical protein ACFLVI_03270 [Chloroflexota bacterium]
MSDKRHSEVSLWISRTAGLLGIVVVIWAFIGGLAGDTGISDVATLLQFSICGFLVAIWALVYEFVKSRTHHKQ